MNNLIVVLGPTGIGKSAVSIKLAEYFNTEIISADSRQFYRELSIGTAVPGNDELREIKHHFVQSISIHDYYNVSHFENEALKLISELFVEKNKLILTGGSMMYIDTLCNGIDNIPTISSEIRDEVRKWYDNNGIEELRDLLLKLDPEYYSIVDLNNHKRMLHAIEVCKMSGATYTSFRTNTRKSRSFNILKIGLNQERTVLYDRINRRVESMMNAGLLDEARSVFAYRSLNSLNTVGYKELFSFLNGDCSLEEAVDLIKRNTRKYARKQLTWFRRDKEINWFEPEQVDEIIGFVSNYIASYD